MGRVSRVLLSSDGVELCEHDLNIISASYRDYVNN